LCITPRGIVAGQTAQVGEIACGQYRSPREELVRDARIICVRRFRTPKLKIYGQRRGDEEAFHDVSASLIVTPTLVASIQELTTVRIRCTRPGLRSDGEQQRELR
jgi:hypothetical protein